MSKEAVKIKEETKEEVYNADKIQTLVFKDEFDSDLEIQIDFEPVSDDRYLQFSADSVTKITDDGTNILPENTKALINLWNDSVTDLRGFEGEKPTDWKEEVDADQVKIPSMSKYLTVSAYSENKKAWGNTDNVIYTECYFGFDNDIARQKHFLRRKTVDDTKIYRKMQKIPMGSRSKGLESKEIILPTFAKEKIKLYEQMEVKEAEGYANRVPAWHKIAVIDSVFASGLGK